MQQRNATQNGMVMGDKTIRQMKGRMLTMAVLIEANSVVIQRETIAEKYPGGLDQYIEDCPNRTLCMDDTIVRLGFMSPADMNAFIGNLEYLGFRLIENGEFAEIAVVDQFDGIVLPCDWLEYLNLVIFEGDVRVSICKSKGKSVRDVAFPRGWNYETSLSKRTLPLDSESIEHRFIFLRRKGGVDFYLDALTGEEMFIDRSARRNTNA